MAKSSRRSREASKFPAIVQNAQRTPDDQAAERPVGIKDIAKALGVSIGTVERAIHAREGINPMTRDRVLKMADTLGYRPNLAARYLKAPRQFRLSINLPARVASFFDSVRDGILDAAGPFQNMADLHFRFHPALGDGDQALFEQALQDGSKGIIIAPGNPAQLKTWIRKAAQNAVPVVCVTSDAPGTERLTCVSADPFTSGAIVGELICHVVHGSGTVAFQTGDLSIFDHAEKLRGFKQSLDARQGSLSISEIMETYDDATTAYTQIRKLLTHDRELKAIHVSTANSLGVIRALEEMDPERRIVLITTDLFPELVPHLKSGRILATINQRPEAQGRLALEALLRYLTEGKCPPARIRLNPHIVMRSNLDLFWKESEPQMSAQTGGK